MEVINPAMIDCTLDQIGGNERVKKDLVRCRSSVLPASMHLVFAPLRVLQENAASLTDLSHSPLLRASSLRS